MDRQGRKIGFTSVVGDLFHAGHIEMIQECRQHCDYLIVAVMAGTDDRQGKNKPVQSLFERCWQVRNTKGVDEIVACGSEDDLLLALKVLRPWIEVRFVGDDYRGRDFTGKAYCEQSGIELRYTRRDHGLSSSELRDRITGGGQSWESSIGPGAEKEKGK